ncbi:hypothetical protein JCM11251_002529 [Rhodosporidiobolus azoricus]
MDDNPWDAPSPSPAAPKPDSPPTSPRLSYSPDDDERPTWGAPSPIAEPVEGKAQKPEQPQEADEGDDDKVVTEQQQVDVEAGTEREEDVASLRGEKEDIAESAATDDKSEDVARSPSPDEEDGPADVSVPGSPKIAVVPESTPEESAEPGSALPTLDTQDGDEPAAASTPSPEPVVTPAAAPESSTEPVPLLPSVLSDPDPDPSANGGPPMDSLSDDGFDDGFVERAAAAAPPAAATGGEDDGFDDGFDDFGEAGGEGGEDEDFGDFGDFGDTTPLDESAFDAPAPSLPPPIPVVAPTAPPPAPSYPPLRLDLSNATSARRTVAPQLKEFCKAVWADAEDSVSDEPERQAEGVAQVLVTESARNLLVNLSTLPQLQPLDWRRSKIRREHLIAMGIPVNLDDTTAPKYPSLSVHPGASRRLGPLATSHSPTRSSSAPPISGSALPFSSGPSSLPGSRSSTPFAERERTRAGMAPPQLDKARAEELTRIGEEDLRLMSLEKLQGVQEELDRFSVEASGVLTHALMMREKEGQDKEVYNGMIQDLVIAAAKMKTSSAGGTAVKRISFNLADLTRYAKNPRRVIWTNIFSLTVLVTLCAILGVVVTSATEVIYGKHTWNPLQASQLMGRAPKFFTAFCWALAVLSTNISANSTAVSNDLMIMFPKWINIRRGQKYAFRAGQEAELGIGILFVPPSRTMPSTAFDPRAVAADDSLRLLSFTSGTAFTLGCRIRSLLRQRSAEIPTVMSIETAQGQPLFFAASREGSVPAHAVMVKRKGRSVLRIGKSTAALHLQFDGKLPEWLGLDEKDYAIDGGAFPIRVKGVEPIVAVVAPVCLRKKIIGL